MDLKDVIMQDCKLYCEKSADYRLIGDDLGLVEYNDSEQTGLYSLEYNGDELWFGTLHEINAIVKSMLRRMELDMH